MSAAVAPLSCREFTQGHLFRAKRRTASLRAEFEPILPFRKGTSRWVQADELSKGANTCKEACAQLLRGCRFVLRRKILSGSYRPLMAARRAWLPPKVASVVPLPS